MVDLWENLVEKAHFTFKTTGSAGQSNLTVTFREISKMAEEVYYAYDQKSITIVMDF